jgi:hypothetical protein
MIIWDKKIYTAFGYKVIRTNYKAGETLNDLAPENRKWYNLFTRGGFTNCRTDADSTPANHATEDTTVGSFYTPTRFQEFYGSLTADIPTDTTIWCLCQEHNDETLPDSVNKWHLAKDAIETLSVGTKLLLVRGDVTINAGEENEASFSVDTATSNPKAINVSTNSSTITATSDHVYGILFA